MIEPLRTVDWQDDELVLIDQTRIPETLSYVRFSSPEPVVRAIKTMVVRGAPAIGAAGAYGIVLALRQAATVEDYLEAAREIRNARPTAVNLAWAVDRVMAAAQPLVDGGLLPDAAEAALQEAHAIAAEDVAANAAIARTGAQLVPERGGVLTHCNTGDLATVSGGTAFGILRQAHQDGKDIVVFADETRPRFQGLRLTAWELARSGVPVRVIPDGAAGWVMLQGLVSAVFVGADRIAANGDVANKIGTYSVACLARDHGIPFYVAAPVSTIDIRCPDGSCIPIEERDPAEVAGGPDVPPLPGGASVFNPAFDVTPADLVSGIITEKGLLQPDYLLNIRRALEER